MLSLIRLLPEHIANQIAAGEVVQRPASVVKELLENSVDAGAKNIQLIIKDAGKVLIQVIDDGSGMSSHDARMCFERHATSKIKTAEDLFNIRTMGFRGEAMASIAAVAHVQMKTRLHDEELGTEILIEGSTIKKHEPTTAPKGTSISVRNLFFNIPARRNFLKSNPVETRHILQEFTRVAMAHPEVSFSLDHNGTEVYNLSPSSFEGRILKLIAENYSGTLLPVKEETLYLRIKGFIAGPEGARKSRGDQFFFVNNRFIKSGYLHHAVASAFQGLLPQDAHPFYAIWLDIDPKHIDINIHPTKTEIKFDDESGVYSLLHSVIRKSLASIHPAPELDSENEMAGIIRSTPPPPGNESTIGDYKKSFQKESAAGWEELFKGIEKNTPSGKNQPELIPFDNVQSDTWIQFNDRYILSPTSEGLIILDMVHAHQRILYERYLKAESLPPLSSQQLLYPKSILFQPQDFAFLKSCERELHHLGFDFKEFGVDNIILHGIPSELSHTRLEQFFEELISEARETDEMNPGKKLFEMLAVTISMRAAIQPGKKLSSKEMTTLYEDLLRCTHPGISPSGKPTWFQLEYGYLSKYFGR